MKGRLLILSLCTFTMSGLFVAPPNSLAQSNPTSRVPAGNVKAPAPKCSEPNPRVDAPNGPHGLFVPLFPHNKLMAEAEKYLLNNPLVCGANLYVVWSQSDRGPSANPRYDFSYVEQQMTSWTKAGKSINLIVWPTTYSAVAARATPDYVMAQTPTVECRKFGRVPVFWEKTFVNNYRDFMSAVVQKFGNDPAIGYIRFGLAAGGETFPACFFALRDRGMTEEIWRNYLLGMLDYEKSLNSPKLLMVGLNGYGVPQNTALPDALAERAAQNGIAIGSEGLRADDIQADSSGGACTVDWCRIFREFHGKVPMELQTAGPTHPDGSAPGSLVQLLPFALKNHTQIFEVLLPDWLIAYDPGNPDYARYHAQYQEALQAAADVLGGR